MEGLQPYDADLTLGKERFCEKHKGFYLCRQDAAKSGGPGAGKATMNFRTQFIKANKFLLQEDGTTTPVVLAVRKKNGNPFAERISIGRAPNCDIVLRLPYVSKLHGHFSLTSDNNLCLCDAGSANGTFLNAERMKPQETLQLALGDNVRFGSFEMTLVDEERLFYVVEILAEPKTPDW